MTRSRIVLAGALLAVLAACTPTPTTSPVTTPPVTTPSSGASPSTSEPSPSASTVAPSPDPFAPLTRLVLTPPATLAPSWSEVFSVPYGDAPGQLGTSLGGDDGGIRIGPSYGTQVPDGTWWFMDTAHARLAHFSDAGAYLGEVRIPAKYLTGGQYVQYQSPLALADGTVVLQSTTPGDSAMLTLAADGTLARVPLDRFVGVKVTDGTHLYGFDQDNRLVKADPRTGTLSFTDAVVGQGDLPFTLTTAPGRLGLTRPGVTLDLPLFAAEKPTSVVHPMVEGATGADGVLNILVTGLIEDAPGEISEVAGFVRVDAAGRGFVEQVRPLSSTADPSDGGRLGVRLGDSRPWLMLIDTDAVRVFRRG